MERSTSDATTVDHCPESSGQKGHRCLFNPAITPNAGDAATSPDAGQKHPRSLPQGRVGSSGRRGMSQERPAALETAPEGWRPRSAAPWRARVGAGGSGNGHREGPPEGTGMTPTHPRAPPGYAPALPERRSPSPASPSPRPPHAPPQAARDQPPTAPSPGPEEDAGGGAAGPRPVPARTAPPPRRNKAPRGRAGGQHSPRTRGPGRGAREPPQAGPEPSARCSPRAAGPGRQPC